MHLANSGTPEHVFGYVSSEAKQSKTPNLVKIYGSLLLIMYFTKIFENIDACKT